MDYQSRQFLAPPSTRSVTKSPSRQHLSLRKSSASLRDATPSTDPDGGGGGGTMVSLAHELAAAMMPEPNLTSQMLAEEFGIDFDDGAEGATVSDDTADERRQLDPSPAFMDAHLHAQDEYQSPLDAYTSDVDLLERSAPSSFTTPSALQDRNSLSTAHPSLSSSSSEAPDLEFLPDADDAFGPSTANAPSSLDLLAQNLKATDLFIAQLRSLDMDTRHPGMSGKEPPQFLEACTTTLVSHLNDAVRDREGQVRQLSEYDREFKKMAAEIGGAELLGNLDQLLDNVTDDGLPAHQSDDEEDVQRTPRSARRSRATHSRHAPPKGRGGSHRLPGLQEEADVEDDWDLEDEGDGTRVDSDDPITYARLGSSRRGKTRKTHPAPEAVDDASISGIFPHLNHLRNVTHSLVNSFTSLSEQAQVNAVKTADVGRKLRALKHKVEELKADWDTADRSRIAIDRWEAGLMNGSDAAPSACSSPTSSPKAGSPHANGISRRIDGRRMVQEQMRGFESTLDEAVRKVRVIMSTV